MLEKYAVVKAIETVTSEPNRQFSVRGLAKQAGLSPGAAKISLDYMQSAGLVKLQVIGRSHLFKADLESALCRQWKILFNIEQLQKARIVGKLLAELGEVHSILLYGSCGKGTNDEKSDFDLLVIAHKPKRIEQHVFSKLGREANCTVLELRQWQNKVKVDRVFYESIIYDSIPLFGNRPVVL